MVSSGFSAQGNGVSTGGTTMTGNDIIKERDELTHNIEKVAEHMLYEFEIHKAIMSTLTGHFSAHLEIPSILDTLYDTNNGTNSPFLILHIPPDRDDRESWRMTYTVRVHLYLDKGIVQLACDHKEWSWEGNSEINDELPEMVLQHMLKWRKHFTR
jgi:hypothetical protein